MELSEKALEKSRIMEEKAKEYSIEQQNLKPQIPILIEQTKFIQKRVKECAILFF